jgi:hypothetical protein
MVVVNGKVHGRLPVKPWQLRVSTEGQEHISGMHHQRATALQGAVTFRVNGVHQERHVAAYLVGPPPLDALASRCSALQHSTVAARCLASALLSLRSTIEMSC